jgi:L-ascorbate metabolism protein UlaG (beta-lactamase superfamily)
MPARRVSILAALAVLTLGGGGYVARALSHPHIDLPPDRTARSPSANGMSVRFLGTSSLLFQDAQTSLLSEGFVSRPGLLRVALGRIAPDSARIASVLNTLGADTIAAIFVGHSHYDHALDAPTIARWKHSVLLGSTSTAILGRTEGLDSGRIFVVRHGTTQTFGRFSLTFLQSLHSPGDRYPDSIRAPFTIPARASKWRNGGTWSVLIRHDDRSVLVNGSANFIAKSLEGIQADVVYLGVARLGKESEAFAHEYWCHVVRGTGARRVFLVHWDDFFLSLEDSLRPLPRGFDSFPTTLERLERWAQRDSVEVLVPQLFEPTDPFDGLPAPEPLSRTALEQRRAECLDRG